MLKSVNLHWYKMFKGVNNIKKYNTNYFNKNMIRKVWVYF